MYVRRLPALFSRGVTYFPDILLGGDGRRSCLKRSFISTIVQYNNWMQSKKCWALVSYVSNFPLVKCKQECTGTFCGHGAAERGEELEEERMAIKGEEWGGGGLCSQVFLPFEEGIPPLPLRKKIINTFSVAMPTRGLSLRSQLWAFLAVITHSSRALHNYPGSICTSNPRRRVRYEEHREAPAVICIYSHKTAHSLERSHVFNRGGGGVSASINMTFALTICHPRLAPSLIPSHFLLLHIYFFTCDLNPQVLGMSLFLWETSQKPTAHHAVLRDHFNKNLPHGTNVY